jgi:hypothetical protein
MFVRNVGICVIKTHKNNIVKTSVIQNFLRGGRGCVWCSKRTLKDFNSVRNS